MRKLLYLILLIASLIGLISVFFLPILKFNDEKTAQNSERYMAIMSSAEFKTISQDVNYELMDKENKAEADVYIKKTLTTYHTLINLDKDQYYNIFGYKILNLIDKEENPDSYPDDPLFNENSTEEEKALFTKMYVRSHGQDVFDEKKTNYVDQEINKDVNDMYKNFLESCGYDVSSLSTDEIISKGKEVAVKGTKGMILDEFLLLFVGADEELRNEIINDATVKGLQLTQLVNTFKYVYQIDKTVFSKEEYKDLNFFKKIAVVQKDDDFYNPIPLLIFGLVFIVIWMNLLTLFFKGIKGMRGKKYPHTFIQSIIMLGITIGLLLLPALIPQDYFLSHHSENMCRLLDLLRCSEFTLLLYIFIGIFIYSLVLSIIGRFFKYGKLNKNKKGKELED